jgi:hypothetical protein
MDRAHTAALPPIRENLFSKAVKGTGGGLEPIESTVCPYPNAA